MPTGGSPLLQMDRALVFGGITRQSSEGAGRQVPVAVDEPVGIAVGMGSEHEQKTQYLQRELKLVDHRVGVAAEWE